MIISVISEDPKHLFNFTRPAFSVIYQQREWGAGGGGWRGELRGHVKSQDYHQPIEMKFCKAKIGCLMQNLSRIVVPFSLGKIFPSQEGNKWIGMFTR